MQGVQLSFKLGQLGLCFEGFFQGLDGLILGFKLVYALSESVEVGFGRGDIAIHVWLAEGFP